VGGRERATLLGTTPSVLGSAESTSPNTRFAREGRKQEPPLPSSAPPSPPPPTLASLAGEETGTASAVFGSQFWVLGRKLALASRSTALSGWRLEESGRTTACG